MPIILDKKNYLINQSVGESIDYGNPLSKGLSFVGLFNKSAGKPVDLINHQRSNSSLGGWSYGKKGRSFRTSANGDFIRWPSDPRYQIGGNKHFSIFIVLENTGRNGDFPGIIGSRTTFNANGSWLVYNDYSSSEVGLHFAFWNGASETNVFFGNYLPAASTGVHSIGITRSINEIHSLYIDGILKTTISEAGSPTVAGSHQFYIGSYGDGEATANYFCKYYFASLWKNRLISPNEFRRLHRNPFQFIKKDYGKLIFNIVQQGGQDATATPSKASITVLVNSPTLKITRSSIATPSLASIKVLINTSTASTSVSYSATATPSLASVRILIGTATASTSSSSSSTVTPSLIRTKVLVNSPTVNVAQSRTVSPSVASIKINIFTATASTGAVRNANATPSISTSRFIVNSPTVSIKANRLVQPSTASITIIVLSASASTPGVSGLTITILKQSKIEKTIYDKSRIEKFILGESPIQ